MYLWTSTTFRTYTEREEEELIQQLEMQLEQRLWERNKQDNIFTMVSVGRRRNNDLNWRELAGNQRHFEPDTASSHFRRPLRAIHPLNETTQSGMSSGYVSVVTPHESQNTPEVTDGAPISTIRVHFDQKKVDELLKHSSSPYDHEVFNVSQDNGLTHTHPTTSTSTKTYNSRTAGIKTTTSALPPSSSAPLSSSVTD